MIKFINFFILISIFIFKSGYGRAWTIQSLPNPTKLQSKSFISNPDQVILSGDQQEIANLLDSIHVNTTNQVAVVVVRSINEESSKNFAHNLFNEWGIGKADKDNGVLLLLVMDSQSIEIEVGYGLEGTLTDYQCSRIIRDLMVPNLKQGKVTEALKQALNQMNHLMKQEMNDFAQSPQENISSYTIMSFFSDLGSGDPEFIGYLIIFFLVVLQFFKKLIIRYKFKIFIFISIIGLTITGFFYLPSSIQFFILVNVLFFFYLIYRKKWWQSGFFREPFIIPMEKWQKAIFFVCFGFFKIFEKFKVNSLQEELKLMELKGFELVLDNSRQKFLNKNQLKEEEILSVINHVYLKSDGTFEVLRKLNPWTPYSQCQICSSFGAKLTKREIMSEATYNFAGQGIDKFSCECCLQNFEKIFTIPQLTRVKSASSTSSSSGSKSSKSSSFGGGRSGGGGASGKW